MTNMADEDSDEESDEPERMSLVDLKHRGKKKAIVPVNRVRAVLGRKYMHVRLPWLQFTLNSFFVFLFFVCLPPICCCRSCEV